MFKREYGNWVAYRSLPDLMEVDFHWSGETTSGCYWENMQFVYERALQSLKNAQRDGKKFVLFTHGWSSSRVGKTTSRSQVRKLMSSKDATPYIIRRDSIQHDSVFVAAIPPLDAATPLIHSGDSSS